MWKGISVNSSQGDIQNNGGDTWIEDAEAGIDAALKGGFWTVGVGHSRIQHAHIVSTVKLITFE